MVFNFLGFEGHYGGDEYERLFCYKLISYSSKFKLNRIISKRKGGFRSIFGLLKLLTSGYLSKGKIIRPFGIPFISYEMTVILHHYDQSGSPFYTKFLEKFDLILLKLFAKKFKIKFITVSKYWADWVKVKFNCNSYVIYNEIDVNNKNLKSKQYLSNKYNLDFNSSWVFLGSNQSKKGGDLVINNLKLNYSDKLNNVQIIQSGSKPVTDVDFSVIRWIEAEDYISFLNSCYLVVANSQFKEGWCRVLHEAALLDVFVAGSGSGGMNELLELINGKSSYTLDEMCNMILNNNLCSKPINSRLLNLKYISELNFKTWINSFFSKDF